MVNQNEFNVWNPWDPLKTVMLATLPSADYFANIRLFRNQQPLVDMLQQTADDLDNLHNTLEEHGVHVKRQQPNTDKRFDPSSIPYIDKHVQPRPNHNFMVLGNNMCSNHDGYRLMAQWDEHFPDADKLSTQPLAWFELTKILASIQHKVKFTQWMMLGKHLIANYTTNDKQYRHWIFDLRQWVSKWIPNVRLQLFNIDNMWLTICRPGYIITNVSDDKLKKAFPGWKIWTMKEHVDILMIDNNTACVTSKYDKELFKYLHQLDILPIHTPLRHTERWHTNLHWMYTELERVGTTVVDYIYGRNGIPRFTLV
jgi:hypothetical protein